MRQQIAEAAEVLSRADQILVFTGAGLSTEAGIPDFRGPDGLWTKMDPDDFTIQRWLARKDIRERGWNMHLEGELWGARSKVEPTEGHRAIVKLAQARRLAGVVTQNVDGLHHKSGLADDQVAELHGDVRTSRCLSCDSRWPTETVLGWIEGGDEDPHCPACAGMVKTNTVLFGEMLPEEEMRKAGLFLAMADAVIVVGSTVSVWPAADVVFRAASQSKPVVVVNRGPTEIDSQAAVLLDAGIGDVLPDLVSQLVG